MTRLTSDATIYRELLDNDRLKDPDNGVSLLPAKTQTLFRRRSAECFLLHSAKFLDPS